MKTLLSSISAIFVALLASICCIAPLIAFAGLLGVTASQLVWLSSIKPYLIAISLIAIAYSLYRAYFPPKKQDCCSTEKKKLRFYQTKAFLWAIAILILTILLLPYLIN